MIDRSEILAVASDLSLSSDVVEKDYVLGWLLAGIYANAELSAAWIFKGGTCLKKCYFETYRFSEDLDFTITDKKHLDVANAVNNNSQSFNPPMLKSIAPPRSFSRTRSRNGPTYVYQCGLCQRTFRRYKISFD